MDISTDILTSKNACEYPIIAPPHSGMSAANPAGGHGTTLKKTIKTREDPDPPPNSSYFLCHASFFSFLFVSFSFCMSTTKGSAPVREKSPSE